MKKGKTVLNILGLIIVLAILCSMCGTSSSEEEENGKETAKEETVNEEGGKTETTEAVALTEEPASSDPDSVSTDEAEADAEWEEYMIWGDTDQFGFPYSLYEYHTADELFRNSDDYEGRRVMIAGELTSEFGADVDANQVTMITKEYDFTTQQASQSVLLWKADKTLYDGPNFRTGDIVVVYGSYKGIVSGANTLGGTSAWPTVVVYEIGLADPALYNTVEAANAGLAESEMIWHQSILEAGVSEEDIIAKKESFYAK